MQGPTRTVNEQGHLTIGGVDAVKLKQTYQTPLIAYDVSAIKEQINDFKKAFVAAGVKYRVVYASKAFSALAMYQLISAAGIGCDVVSGGELYAALKGGMDPKMIEFHGNNKLPDELRMAVKHQIGTVIVDNFHEIELLNHITQELDLPMNVMVRVVPGVEAETHRYIQTGQANSKFGFDITSGQAKRALQELLACPKLTVTGVHCHIGSQIFGVKGFELATQRMVALLKEWHDEFDFTAQVLNLGGGFGIKYTAADEPKPAVDFVKTIIQSVKANVAAADLPLPEIWIEPGRALAGEAATTLYTVGSRKDVDGVCHFVAVDGGMGDNIRPALYQAKYEAFVANKANAINEQIATVVGKYCESGDILVKNCPLPNTHPGDIIAIPATGAYGYTMASNYNRNPRPAVVFCENGKSRLVVRRETYADMLACEVPNEEEK